jgi:cytochrome c553
MPFRHSVRIAARRSTRASAITFAVILFTVGVLERHSSAQAQAGAAATVWNGVYTSDQAVRGKASYDGVCARCHGAQLTGGTDGGPTLKGAGFLAHWNSDTLGSLYVKIRDTMPRNTPGTISEQVKVEILAYLLEQNGFPAGRADLALNLPALDEVKFTRRGIWDGVFSAAQADRGKATATQARCTGCHGGELGGTDRAPALKGPAFLADWEDGSLSRLFAKVRDTMPPGNTDQLAPAAKLDVVTYLLRENGFPPGASELPNDSAVLDGVQIVKKGSDSAGASNYSLVEVIGCLSGGGDKGWTLSSATEPTVTRDDTPSAAALKSAEARSLGSQTIRLVSVVTSMKPDALKGNRVEARGLLYRDAAYSDLNLVSLNGLGAACQP